MMPPDNDCCHSWRKHSQVYPPVNLLPGQSVISLNYSYCYLRSTISSLSPLAVDAPSACSLFFTGSGYSYREFWFTSAQRSTAFAIGPSYICSHSLPFWNCTSLPCYLLTRRRHFTAASTTHPWLPYFYNNLNLWSKTARTTTPSTSPASTKMSRSPRTSTARSLSSPSLTHICRRTPRKPTN